MVRRESVDERRPLQSSVISVVGKRRPPGIAGATGIPVAAFCGTPVDGGGSVRVRSSPRPAARNRCKALLILDFRAFSELGFARRTHVTGSDVDPMIAVLRETPRRIAYPINMTSRVCSGNRSCRALSAGRTGLSATVKQTRFATTFVIDHVVDACSDIPLISPRFQTKIASPRLPWEGSGRMRSDHC
jgi:hypothetical protein